MKILLYTITILFSIIILLLIGSFFISSNYLVERSIVINAKAETIFPYFDSLKLWQSWTVWNNRIDPTLQVVYEGPENGPGAKQMWSGEAMGIGQLIVIETIPDRMIRYNLTLEEEHFNSVGTIFLKEQANVTFVKWTTEGEVAGNPFLKYFVLFVALKLARKMLPVLFILQIYYI